MINPTFDLEFALRRLAVRVMEAGMASGTAADALASLLGKDDADPPNLPELPPPRSVRYPSVSICPPLDWTSFCLRVRTSIGDFLLLPELLASFGRLGYDVVEMVVADQESWDRYEAAKWLTMRRWLEANPDDDLRKRFEPA